MVQQGRFREDLFFRLSVFQIGMPPLRDRRVDIPALVQHLLARRVAPAGGEALSIDAEAMDMLTAFHWPGNVRQLENVLHRAAILADGGCIRAGDLPPEVSRSLPALGGAVTEGGELPLRERVRRFEVSLILRAIDECGGDRRAAAAKLGIGLSSLYRKLEEFQGDMPAGG
jgi:two-component system response regulator AtoC